jgi:hypothetical protein
VDDKVESLAGTDPNDATAFPDTQAPLITLLGTDPMVIAKNDPFIDPGAEVTDNIDATRVIYSLDTINTSLPGTYFLEYATQDAQGNPAIPVSRTVIVAPNMEDWLGSISSSPGMMEKYVFGGAIGPDAESEPISLSKVGAEVTLSVIVRTNDPKVSVWGEVTSDLADFSSPTTRQTISGVPAASQEGVPAGCQRQVFKMNADGLQRGFLRVRADIAN